MVVVHVTVGAAVVALNALAGLWGAWCWSRARASPPFWTLLRAAQTAVLLQVVLGVTLLLLGHHPKGNLHILYGVLPVAVMFFAEQLRIGVAEQVLDARDLEGAEDVGRLPEDDQRDIVLAIVRRETGVMAAAALVVVVLALRAVSVAGGF